MKKTIVLLLIGVLTAVLFICGTLGIYHLGQPTPLACAVKQLEIGMPRDRAIEIFAPVIWYHQPCLRGSDFIQDVFFYGSHQYDTDDVLIVTSRAADGVFIVEHIGSFEPNAWHTAYRDCIQRDKFID